MHIALLSPNTLRKNTAGLEQAVFYLAQFLQKKGHRVEIFCTSQSPQETVEYQGLTLHEYPRWAPNNAYFFSLPLYRALKKGNFDIIHAYGYNNFVSFLGLLAKKKGQKYILTGASSVSSSPIRKYLHAPLNFSYTAMGERIDKLICVSEYEYALFKKSIPLPEHKYVLIPNGIPVEELQAIPKKINPHMILSVGRLVKQKGMHRLIAALPLIRKSYPDVQLHIVGDGIERQNLENQARESGMEKNIVFHGHIQFDDKEKLYELYARCHVFSLMADSESQGLVYGMAAAMRTPILTTNHSAMKDLVRAGVAKGIDNPDDIESIAKGMMQLFEEKPPRVDIEKVVWSWDRVGTAIEGIYHELLGKSKQIS